jgi:hypothetical protein
MNRIISIVLTELASDKLKYEEDMEKAINGSESAKERASKVKYNLEKIVLTELMIEKWRNYTTPQPASDNK